MSDDKPNGEMPLAKRPLNNGPEVVKVDVRKIIEVGGVEILTYDSRMVETTIKGCRTLLSACSDPEKTSDFEIGCFLAWCAANKYDPLFRKQAYFIRYKAGEPPSFVVNYEVFIDRAQRHPMFDGMESGVVWRVDGKKVRGKPCDYPRDAEHEIVGGWAVVHRKDRKYPVDVECPLDEIIKKYSGKPMANWKEGKDGGQQTWMIEKVPKARGLRAAFPEELAGQFTDIEPMIPLETGQAAAELPSREDRAEPPQEAEDPQEPVSGPIAKVAEKMLGLMAEAIGGEVVPPRLLHADIADLACRVAGGDPADYEQSEAWTDELADKCIKELERNGLDPTWLPGVQEGAPVAVEVAGQQKLPLEE